MRYLNAALSLTSSPVNAFGLLSVDCAVCAAPIKNGKHMLKLITALVLLLTAGIAAADASSRLETLEAVVHPLQLRCYYLNRRSVNVI